MLLKQSILLFTILIGGGILHASTLKDTEIKTVKEERNLVNKGNELYKQQRFADAEVLYRKALEANHGSEFASYNLATALLRQTGTKDLNNQNNPLAEAQQLLTDLLANAKNPLILEKASYNLGNIAFNNNNFQQSIEYYKNALRQNPGNDLARQNLRLAQKKLQEQQNDNKQNQNNEQQKQENKEQQQKKDEDKKQDQNKDQQQQPDQKKEEKKENAPEQQNGISDSNADKILKAMENEEAATRRRVEAQRKKGGQANMRQPLKPW